MPFARWQHGAATLVQVLFEMKYNGQDADVWSCGVSLYVMLTGVFPFSRPTDEVRHIPRASCGRIHLHGFVLPKMLNSAVLSLRSQ